MEDNYIKCFICKEDITEEPFASLGTKYHQACLNCFYCGHAVQLEIVQKEVKNEETICHKPCESKFMEQEFKNRPIVITQAKLDYLNRINLMFDANLDLSIESNQNEARLLAGTIASEMSADQLFLTVKRMEMITAVFGLVSSKTKDKAIINLGERSKKKQQEVEEYRKKQLEPKAPKVAKQYEKLTDEERTERNTINSFMKAFKWTKEQALEEINKAKSAAKGSL